MTPSHGPVQDGRARDGLLVVGGGPAGLEAARAYRDADAPGPVRIVSDDVRAPYQRPPLSKDFLRGETEEQDLPLEDPSFYAEQRIELLLGAQAVELDPDRREVVLADGRRLGYAALVLATGGRASTLPVPGGDHPRLHVLRSHAHSRALRDAASTARAAVVVGSGFIGCEAAVSLARRGLDVTVVSTEQLPQQGRLGDEVARRLARWLELEGVTVVGGSPVASFEDGTTVHLEGGGSRTADLVVVATGATPRAELADLAGLEVADGRVVADEQLRTSAPGVWVAGDVALAHHGAAGRRVPVEHWGDALAMGEVAGANAAGQARTWSDVPGFWSEIGDRVLKYAAWGDGHDEVRVVDHDGGGFTAWYTAAGRLVGVLTHEADEDYERGQRLVEQGAPAPR